MVASATEGALQGGAFQGPRHSSKASHQWPGAEPASTAKERVAGAKSALRTGSRRDVPTLQNIGALEEGLPAPQGGRWNPLPESAGTPRGAPCTPTDPLGLLQASDRRPAPSQAPLRAVELAELAEARGTLSAAAKLSGLVVDTSLPAPTR